MVLEGEEAGIKINGEYVKIIFLDDIVLMRKLTNELQ